MKKISFDKNFRTIILTSIATAILTAATGYFLQWEQRKHEYKYWKNKFIIEQLRQNLNEKILLCEKINDAFLKLNHVALVMKSESEFYKASVDAHLSSDGTKTFDAIYNYFQTLFVLISELQKVTLYFSPSVIDVIEKHSEILSLFYEKNNALIASEIQNKAFIDNKELEKYRHEIISAIMNDIQNSSNQIGMILSNSK